MGYSNTLGLEMSAKEMATAINSLGADIAIDEDTIKLLYYIASDEESPKMTTSEFMKFINDVILPKNALVDLYNMNWYFTTGTYARKEPRTLSDKDQFTTLYNHDERNKDVYCPTFMYLSSLPPNKLTQVDCCGFGCTLIRKDLFEKIEKPYFFFAHEEAPKPGVRAEYCIGEDMYFCRKVVKSGLQIWAHGNVLCGHLGKFVYTLNRS